MRALLTLTVLLATMLAGCTGGNGGGPTYEVPPMEDGKYVIEMTANFRFIPENAEVPVGATVLWRNEGGAHNVKPDDGAWQAGAVSEEDFELVITQDMVGDRRYICVPHESLGMIGNLRVVDA